VVWTGRWDQKDSKIIDSDLVLIKADLADLKTSYTCVNDASIKIQGTDPTQYKAVISDATEINKYAVVFKTHLTSLTEGIKESSKTTIRTLFSTKSVGETNIMLSKAATALAPVITDLDVVIDYSSKLAAGNFTNYETNRKAVSTGPQTEEIKVEDITAPIVEKTKDDPLLKEKDSLVAKVDGLAPDKAKEAFQGDYTTQDKLTEFTTNLQNKKYALASIIPDVKPDAKTQSVLPGSTTDSNLTPEQQLQAAKDKAAADQAIKDKATADQADKDKQFKDLQDAVKAMQIKADIPPGSTTANTAGGGGAGGGASGSVNAQAPQPYDAAREAERKKWLERARQMDNEAMKRAMAQALKGGKGVSQAKFVKEKGSAFSLRDLFGKSDEAPAPTNDKKTKDLAFMDKDFMSGFGSATETDKYKKYYGTGVGPNETSTKNLNRSNFDNMYEQARIKALTEDAIEQLAGRYVDLFLLVHSIVDDYYRKGLLVDTSEVVEPVSLKSSPRI